MRLAAVAAIAGVSVVVHAQTPPARPVDALKPVYAVPAHVIAQMQEPIAVTATPDGDLLILDRRAHALYRVDRNGRNLRRYGQIGYEPGNLLRPSMISMGKDDIFALMDAPSGVQRIQWMATSGLHIGQFYLPAQGTPNAIVGDQVITGAGAMAFTGQTFLVNEPAWGSLMAEMDTTGRVVRHIGLLRATGQERDTDLHLALNAGLPVVDPTGGYYFVFQTGLPMFRKYDARGVLLYERHIEGPDLDPLIQTLPNQWLRRPADAKPFPQPLIRTAAADAKGRLWIAARTGFTHVFDQGQKVRTVVFEGVRALQPTSFFFTRTGRLLVGPEGYEFDVER